MAADASPPLPAPPASDAAARRVVVVLGMHRSGTSAVAGCFQRLGVDFGPRLMPATPDNPRGYYEHIDVVNVHDRLLLALDRSWDDTGPLPPGWWQDEAVAGRYRAALLALLRRDFPAVPIWGLKDPRLCRLLPAWEPLWREMNSEPLFVLVRRSPADVRASLARREGFSAGKSYLLWLQHTLEVERFTRGRNRVMVDFGAFLVDWRRALETAVGRLGVLPPTSEAGDDSTGAGFVDAALARSGVGGAASERLPPWVEQADAALRLGLEGREAEMQGELDRVAEHLRAAESLYVSTLPEAAADLRHQLEAARRQASWYEAEWQKARAKAEAAQVKLVAKRQEIERLKSHFGQ